MFSSLAGAFAGQGALLVSGILAARLLGPENRGHLALLTLIPIVICQIGMLGIEKAITFHIARDVPATASIVATAKRLGMMQSIVCSIVNGLILWLLLGSDADDVRLSAAMTLIVPVTIVVRNYALAVLQGMRLFRAFNFQRNVQPYLYAAGLLLLTMFYEPSLIVLTGMWTLTSIAAAALGLIAVARSLNGQVQYAPASPSSRELVRFGAKSFLGSASPLETFRLDQAVVGLFLSPVALGIYVASVSFTNLPRFVAQSIGIVAFPHIAAQPNDKLATRSMWRFFWLSLAISVAIVIPLVLAAPKLVPLAFGDDFRGAIAPMQILLIGSVIFGARRVLSDGMRGRGMQTATTWAEVASWICLLPALAVFVNQSELEGVALAIVSSAVFGLSTLLWLIIRVDTAETPPVQSVISFRSRIRAGKPPSGSLARWLRTVMIIISWIALATFTGMLIEIIEPTVDTALLTAIGIVLIAPFLVRVLRRQFDLFEPIVLYTLAFGVMFFVRPISMILQDDFIYFRPSRSLDAREGFTEMLVMALIGAIGFLIGYQSSVGRRIVYRLKPPVQNYYLNTVVSGAMGLSLVGIAFFGAYLLKTGRWGSPAQLLQGRESSTDLGSSYLFVGQFVLIPSVLLLIALGRSRRNVLLLLLASATIGIILLRALPTGSRTTLLPFVGGLFIYHYISRGTRPSRRTVLLLGFVVLIGSALLAETRTNSTRQEQGFGQVIVQNVTNPLGALSRLTESGGDASMAPGVASLLPMIPEVIPYEYGMATIGDLLVRPIPRALWPEKPITYRERIAEAIWPDEYNSNVVRPEFSILFSFYLDWGMAGVAIGMALVGMLARILYEYFLRYSTNLVAQLIFAASLTYMVSGMRDSPVGTIVHMCFTVLPIWLLFHVSAIRKRPALQMQNQARW